MQFFMRGVLAVLFLLGVGLCALCLWPAALAIWQGKILLDGVGLAALSAVTPVFLAGVATCAGTAVALAQLDRAASPAALEMSRQTAPSPRPSAAAAEPATDDASLSSASVPATPSGLPSTARRTGPNPLK
ncbi:MAG: hypothetical protein AB7O62_21240 [Pirellulales bacterium]